MLPARSPASNGGTASARSAEAKDRGPLDSRPGRRRAGGRWWTERQRLDVVVEGELVRMRTQPDWIHLVRALGLDPSLDEVGREDVALEQKLVILLEVIEHDVEGAGQLLDLLLL